MSFRTLNLLFVLLLWGCSGLPAGYAQDTTKYTEQNLNFSYKGNKLSGKLIVPKKYKGKLPLIVFVHGSGPEDYSSSDNYRYLWEAFTKIGFACYSWDRPGVGQSQGKWYELSIADRADEVLSAVAQLKTSALIDTSKIGFWGISQAGWVIPIVAEKMQPAFVITVSSPVTTAFEQEQYRVESELKAENYPQADIGQALVYNKQLRAMVQAGEPYDSFAVLQQTIKDTRWAGHVISGTEIVYRYLSIVFKKDQAPDLHSLRCPVLAIWGAHDLVVPPQKSMETYQKELKLIGNDQATLRMIPDADHTLSFNRSGKRTETIARREEYKDKPEEIFAPGYISLMTDWLQNIEVQ